MQERETIQNQLQNLQIQCVKQYLEGKLQTITTKEVVSDIIKGFIQISNVEFIQSITQSILEAKSTNKNLRKQIEQLKSLHTLELQELETKITEELNQQKEKKFKKIVEESKAKLKSQTIQLQELNQRLLEKQKQNQRLKTTFFSLQKTTDQLTKQLNETSKEKEKISLQLYNTKIHIEKVQRENNILAQKLQEEKTSRKFDTVLADKTLTEIKNTLEQKKFDIQTLENDIFKLAQDKEELQGLFDSKNQENERNFEELKQLKLGRQKIQGQFESICLAKRYLQEENQFLRQEILTFRQREEKLQKELENQKKTLDLHTAEANKLIQTLGLEKLNLQEQLKKDTNNLRENYQAQIQTLITEIQELKVFLQSHKNQLSEAQTKDEATTIELQNLRQENKCLYQQVKLHFEQKQVHENQIKCYEGEMLKVNHDCKAQLDTFKQTYEINWNALNEELIEEKYKSKQLQQDKDQLKEEISLQKDKQKFYEMYVQEISHLRKQLEIVGSNKKYIFSRAELKFEDNKTKFYYYMSKINEQLKMVKNQNKELKTKFLKEVNQYKKYFQQTLLFLVIKIKEESLKCSYCHHQKTIKTDFKYPEKKELGFQKTLPKVSSHELSSFSSLKKTMKNIQQRYQIVNQENKYYNDHISSIMKNA